jgi:hypothetical protein
MPDANVEAIGGWLKDADAHLERTYRRLQDIDPATMNPEHLAYFEDYRTRYFNDRLIHGRGVEEILETLTCFSSTPEHWIDLGAGVTTLFWSIGVNKPKSVSACDIVPEALHILSAFKSSDELPPCYIEAMQLVGRSMKDLQATRSLPWNFHIVDCLSPWSIPGHTDGFDLITAIGCFGLASGKDGYASAFSAAASNLRPTGRLVGVDWVRSATFIAQEGHDNRYVGSDLAIDCARSQGLTILSISDVTIAGDPYYESLVIWAFERNA